MEDTLEKKEVVLVDIELHLNKLDELINYLKNKLGDC
jgi:hypothetical protein